MSHRIWWLIAFCALGIGIAIDGEPPGGKGAMESAAAASRTAVAQQAHEAHRG